jgi:protein TonB
MDIEVPVGVRYDNDKKVKTPDLEDVENVEKIDEQPEYPGGYEAMMRFIAKNMKYPKAAVKQKISGTVYVQFVVDRDGSVTDVRTLKGVSDECDREAERVISRMPKWKPGKLNGENVAVRFVVPLKFKGRPAWEKP